MVKKIINVEDITIAEALKLLEEKLQDIETSDFLNQVLDYLRRFTKVKPEEAKKLVDELVKTYGIARITAIQIVNIMPKSIEELKTILGIERKEFKENELQEMIELINKYRK